MKVDQIIEALTPAYRRDNCTNCGYTPREHGIETAQCLFNPSNYQHRTKRVKWSDIRWLWNLDDQEEG